MPKLLTFIENQTWRRAPSQICNMVLLDHPGSRIADPKKHLQRALLVVNLSARFKVSIFNPSQDMQRI